MIPRSLWKTFLGLDPEKRLKKNVILTGIPKREFTTPRFLKKMLREEGGQASQRSGRKGKGCKDRKSGMWGNGMHRRSEQTQGCSSLPHLFKLKMESGPNFRDLGRGEKPD